MKWKFFIPLILLFFTFPLRAGAQDTDSFASVIESKTDQVKNTRRFGVGGMLGEPTGLTMKYWLNQPVDWRAILRHRTALVNMVASTKSVWLPRQRALSAAVAYPVFTEGWLHLHLDMLWHHYHFPAIEAGIFAPYFGLGGRVRLGDETRAGIRAVMGVEFMFSEAPLDFFVEAAPILDVYENTDWDVNIDAGFRLYFR